ncbi:unnamed protein product [Cuscuta europaea]|uniref:DUF668 domain-containing protein n=1 Tax=Cuscuta europaea TaxID=41803 RepID=A0A9P1DVV1_CUSEU|nr:unnamed protein product [Cuscuta europaea]
MGAVCAGAATAKNKAEGRHESVSRGSEKVEPSVGTSGQNNKDIDYCEYPRTVANKEMMHNLYDSGELLTVARELKPSTPCRTAATNKAPQVSSFLGKAGVVGFEKAVEVLDTLGSSVTNLNYSGFIPGTRSRGNRILILAFEVANTITRGASLSQSLSEESIRYLKDDILHSKAVQELVSTDMKELLTIAAADKRLDSDHINKKQLSEKAEMTMQELVILAQHTSELYHELHALARFEQDYRRQIDELVSLNLPCKGEGLEMLHSELKQQRKTVRSLKKKSLWSKGLEELVEKLVDIVTFLHHEIINAFGESGLIHVCKGNSKRSQSLGAAGLALHYANLITKIDNIASCPMPLPSNMRDTLYNGLPSSVKASLRSQLQSHGDTKEELTIPQIRAKMEKILTWLLPVATDTTKSHQGFGWVGEWANTWSTCGKKENSQISNLIRLQTLYHADKSKMDAYILELVTWLHWLVYLVRLDGSTRAFVIGRSAVHKRQVLQTSKPPNNSSMMVQKVQISEEDKRLLEGVMESRKLGIPVLSKSQELVPTLNNSYGKNEEV